MIVKKFKRRLKYELSCIQFNYSKRRRKKYNIELNINDVKKELASLNSEHQYFHHYFWNLSPKWLKEHRDYFSKDKRGFGEDAFHAMWYFIFNEFNPKQVLEIGVYRGQTISLFSLLANKFGFTCEIHGISPFTSAGDKVSVYLKNLDYENDVKTNFNYFNLPSPILHKGFSTDEEMIKIIESKQWDLIYIDGNHDYEVAKQDFNISSKNIKKGGLIVLDDASLNTEYKPAFYSTAGHPGPSKVASEIDLNSFEEIFSVGHNRIFKKL
ncbi:class I SAM-dependent methyltransferase [Algoriphagus persicinus]|uniref:class I SAM-dependent methyltransferase n=1 Tax=Algoriphagus persicinus TaxID=3108754 RepID=UPI002B3B2B3A|nr:class I SAM-dependent methyltransferase [Algoriphagus sp. E1-3-M2]MEB2786972.1 class I SAM-dependent methyltransferase [Algoriphagus sp. E1-3-M2]